MPPPPPPRSAPRAEGSAPPPPPSGVERGTASPPPRHVGPPPPATSGPPPPSSIPRTVSNVGPGMAPNAPSSRPISRNASMVAPLRTDDSIPYAHSQSSPRGDASPPASPLLSPSSKPAPNTASPHAPPQGTPPSLRPVELQDGEPRYLRAIRSAQIKEMPLNAADKAVVTDNSLVMSPNRACFNAQPIDRRHLYEAPKCEKLFSYLSPQEMVRGRSVLEGQGGVAANRIIGASLPDTKQYADADARPSREEPYSGRNELLKQLEEYERTRHSSIARSQRGRSPAVNEVRNSYDRAAYSASNQRSSYAEAHPTGGPQPRGQSPGGLNSQGMPVRTIRSYRNDWEVQQAQPHHPQGSMSGSYNDYPQQTQTVRASSRSQSVERYGRRASSGVIAAATPY